MDELLVRALLAGLGIGLQGGMLGSFVIWRRMAYMGDAMGHGAILGVALGLLMGVAAPVAVLVTALLAGGVLAFLQRDARLPFDALLVVVSTGALSAGLALYARLPNTGVDVSAYLFGDVLAVGKWQLSMLYGALMLQTGLIAYYWRDVLRMIVHQDIAAIEGVKTTRLQTGMTVLIALTVAGAMQIVGVLLVTALLVIPALTARFIAKNPRQMVIGGTLFGGLTSVFGVLASWQWNISTGPAIILCAVGGFALSYSVRSGRT